MTDSQRQPPYYAVIFSSTRTGCDPGGYSATAEEMERLAGQQPGCLGFESYRDSDGRGVTISYWESLDAIERWRNHPRHRLAQQQGKQEWYSEYRLRICRVESDRTCNLEDS